MRTIKMLILRDVDMDNHIPTIIETALRVEISKYYKKLKTEYEYVEVDKLVRICYNCLLNLFTETILIF